MPATPSSADLKELVDRRTLRRMAGARSFERGEDYFASGQVRALAEHEEAITAKVLGTREYRVKLWVEAGDLEFSCTCPVGTDGAFCKHCVAVGLAWLEQGREGGATSKKPAKPSVTMDDVRTYLTAQGKAALVDLLMAQAMEDDRLRQRLLMKAAKKAPKGLDLATYREAIDSAVGAGEFVDYGSAHDYARGIDEVIDLIEELLKEGHAAEVIDLTEHALATVENAMGSVDDSDGHMGGILERLQEIHHAACKKAKPDPETLAKRLFEWELRADWDTFYGAAEKYADVLGETGLAVYRKLAEAEWARVPALESGRDDPEKYGKRFRITHIMETLARQTGDVEAVAAVKKRDLSSPYAYLQIAETYKQARKHDLALEWAERGLKASPQRTDSRLREFLADEYHRRKRHEEAMDLVWAEFADSPSLEQLQNLKSHADRVVQWLAWRNKALAHMREQALRERGFDVSLVAFLENEDEEWEIREIVQCMACFLKDRWKTVQPTQMYRSKGRALDLFTSSDSHEEFRRLYLVVADVVTLPEFIQSEFSRGEAGKSKRFGGLRAVRTIKKPYTRPGTTFDTGRSDARCTPCAGSGLPSASVGRWQPVFGGLPPAESSLWGR